MKQRENLFLRRPQRRDLLLGGKALLVIALIISGLSACTGQLAHQGSIPSSTRQTAPTSSSTQLLQQEGPTSGLYIGNVGNDAEGNDNALYRVDYQSGKVLWKYQFGLSKPIPGLGKYAPPYGLIVQQGLVFVESIGVVYKSILYINQATLIKGQEAYLTTAMDPGGKVLWKINLGGYAAEVLVS